MGKHSKGNGEEEMNKKYFYYGKEEDIFAVHNGFSDDEKFKGNIVVGDLILDMSTKGRVRGIEIMNASMFFKEIPFEDIIDANLEASKSREAIMISILFKSKTAEIPARIAVPIEMAKV